MISKNLIYGKSSKENGEEYVKHSKSDNIEIMVNDEGSEVIL